MATPRAPQTITLLGGASALGQSAASFLRHTYPKARFDIIDPLTQLGHDSFFCHQKDRLHFHQCDYKDTEALQDLFEETSPCWCLNLAFYEVRLPLIKTAPAYLADYLLTLDSLTRALPSQTLCTHMIWDNMPLTHSGTSTSASPFTASENISLLSQLHRLTSEEPRHFVWSSPVPLGPWMYPREYIPQLILDLVRGKPRPLPQNEEPYAWTTIEQWTEGLGQMWNRQTDPAKKWRVPAQTFSALDIGQAIAHCLNTVLPRNDRKDYQDLFVQSPLQPAGLGLIQPLFEKWPTFEHEHKALNVQDDLESLVRWYLSHLLWCEEIIGREKR